MGSLGILAKGTVRSLYEVVRIGPWLLAINEFPCKTGLPVNIERKVTKCRKKGIKTSLF